MRLAILTFFMFLPTAAHADPVTAAVAAFAAWAGTTVAVVYTVAAVALSAGVAVYGSAQARKAERQANAAANAAMKDRMTTRIASEAPHRYIYGRAKVGASIVAMFTSGNKDQYRHLVCVHANHPCDAIEEVYVNNVPVGVRNANGDATVGRYSPKSNSGVEEEQKTGPTFTLNFEPLPNTIYVYAGSGASLQRLTITDLDEKTVTVAHTGPVTVVYDRSTGRMFGDLGAVSNPPKNNPIVRVQGHLGGADDPADAYLRSVVPHLWPATAVLRGMCYTVITLDLNHPEFQNGQVPIHAVIRGKKLYDPRNGTTAWSQNPALAIRDYLTSPLCDVPAEDLPAAQFIAAANVCDEVINGQARYTINGDITSDQPQASVLESMAQCMAGGIVSTTWDVFAGKYSAPVLALEQSDIVGSIQITPGASDSAIYNGVKGQYISLENKYVLTDFKPYQNAAYRADDGRDLYTNIDFPFSDSLQRVTNLARIFTEDQRNGFTMRAEFSLKAWPLKVGERISFTSSFLGQTAKVYRVTDKSFSPNSAVQLTLKEDAEEIWDFADAVVVDATPNTNLPDPWAIEPLASLALSAGDATLLRQADGTTVPRMLVTWPLAPTPAVQEGGQVEIEWRAVGSTVWSKEIVPGNVTQTFLSPITPGWAYVVRARCVNPYMGTQSNWVSAQHQLFVYEARPVVYAWSASQPAPPDGQGSYAWATEAYAAPSGWSLTVPTPPSGGNETLWEARALVSDLSNTGSTTFFWSLSTVANIGYAPAATGTGPAGYSNARVFAYQRKATAPTGTPGAVNYDFASGSITTATLANGWLKNIPAADGNPLYVTSASASAAGTTDSIASGEWSGAVVLAYDGGAGTPGLNTATVTLYQRTVSATAPALPSNLATYTFATGALVGVNNGWTNYIPSTGGAYLHTTFATAISATASDSIAASEWAAAQLMYDAAALIAAQTKADQAFNNAALANNMLNQITLDSVLDRSEKAAVSKEFAVMNGEFDGIVNQADALGVNRNAYVSSKAALNIYLTGLGPNSEWSNTAVDTSIVRTTFNSMFQSYYDARQQLLNAIVSRAATVADWAGLGGALKPGASRGASINVDPAIENPDAWQVPAGVTFSGGPSLATGATGGQFFSSSGSVGVDLFVYEKNSYKVDPARIYRLTANLFAGSGNNRHMYLFVNFYSHSGTKIDGVYWGGTMSGYVFGGLPPVDQFTRQGADFGPGTSRAIPAGAVTMRIGVWFRYNNGDSTAEQAAQDIRLEDVTLTRAAQAAAEAYALARADLARVNAQAYADGKVTAEEQRAIADAANKAEAARASAVYAAGVDATAKADAARAAAEAYAFTRANLAKTQADAYADGIVSAEEQRAINDATAKANAARIAAETAAAADATAKANVAATTALWPNIAGQPNAPASNATVGAPAGTYVAGVEASALAAQAAAGNSAANRTPLAITQKPSSNFSTPVGNYYRAVGSFVAAVTGAQGTVRYSWTITGGENISVLASGVGSSTLNLQGKSVAPADADITITCTAVDDSRTAIMTFLHSVDFYE